MPKSIKKISKSGEGLVVFLTKEIRELNWADYDYVTVDIEGEGRGAKIVLRRLDV